MPGKGTPLKLEYETQKELIIVFELYTCDDKSSRSAFQNKTVLKNLRCGFTK